MASQNFENQGTSKGKLSSSALNLLKNYDKLVELREQGKSFKEIGQMFGVKKYIVVHILNKKENKLKSRYPKLPILSDSSEDEMEYDDTIQKEVGLSKKIDGEGLYFPSEMGGERYNHDLIVRQYKSITLAK
uniref:HTH psq-type domain-containing protein n=1 Tax=Meloidogyne javanica TaxID=6303 RepID=A0A915LNS3_MELJA